MPTLLDIVISAARPPHRVPLAAAVFEGESPVAEGLPEPLVAALRRLARRRAWRGRRGQVARADIDTPVSLFGLGPRESFDPQLLLAWLDEAVAQARNDVRPRLAIRLPEHDAARGPAAALTLCRRVALGGYRFEEFRTSPPPPTLATVHLLPPAGEVDVYRRAVPAARAVAEAVATARDFANTPPNRATPAWMADEVKRLAQQASIKVKVLGPADMERRGMGGILAVGGGSKNPPRLVRLEWGRGGRQVALVGKGVTFDTGGISIKPSRSMEDMKYDKSGACAVLGIALGAAGLKLPFRFRAYLPLAENMPSGTAYRPSDVVTMGNGKTVEVLNTDAEGRMILADAMAWAAEEGAETLIEMSTLTGATVVALGHHGAALYTPDDRLAAELERAAAVSAERLWRMPLWREFGEEMRGNHADLRNVAGRWGGANCAAAFLGQFAGELGRWAHLDIAGTAYVGSGGKGPAGATGYGVALVLTWLLDACGRL